MTSKKGKWIKFLCAVLSITITLGFSGCSNGTGDDSSSESSDVSGSEDEQTKIHKVGYIFRESVSDGGFAAQICEQRERASNRSSVDTCYVDNVPLTDFENAVKTLSDAGCTDIISCSPAYANVLETVARKYLDLNFISFGSLDGGINVSTYSESMYQGAYVSGLVANFNSKTKKIGVVADPGLTSTVAVINAVELGSQINQDGGATVYAAGAKSDSEIEQAVDALIDEGCDVIVCYTNSGHSADYCQKKGVRFIGCLDYNGREKDYSNMLMYFYCQRDSYFLAQFKSMKLGTWETMSYIGDMSNDIVNVSSALDAADDGSQELRDALAPYVTSGAALVFKGPLKDTNENVKYLENEVMSDYEIAGMNWYVHGVKVIDDFHKPQTDIDHSDLTVKT